MYVHANILNTMKTKKIGILGSGVVGQSLGSGFIKHGYRVMVGTRNAAKLSEWNETASENGTVGSFAETAAFGDIIVLAVKGSAAKEVLELAGTENLNSKTIIDASNPIEDTPPENGVLKFFTNLDESLMEQLQNAFPAAHFVKAFNSINSAYMVDPPFESKPTMFICGNDGNAKKTVIEILDQFGWDIEDMGKIEAARAIEPLCMLYCIPGIRENRWTHAFKLLKL